MDALRTVFDKIKEVFAIIMDFFKTLFPKAEDDETAAE